MIKKIVWQKKSKKTIKEMNNYLIRQKINLAFTIKPVFKLNMLVFRFYRNGKLIAIPKEITKEIEGVYLDGRYELFIETKWDSVENFVWTLETMKWGKIVRWIETTLEKN